MRTNRLHKQGQFGITETGFNIQGLRVDTPGIEPVSLVGVTPEYVSFIKKGMFYVKKVTDERPIFSCGDHYTALSVLELIDGDNHAVLYKRSAEYHFFAAGLEFKHDCAFLRPPLYEATKKEVLLRFEVVVPLISVYQIINNYDKQR